MINDKPLKDVKVPHPPAPTKRTHGGANRGQGRKNKFGEPTALLHIRVPASKQAEFKKVFESILKPFQVIPTKKII